MKKIKSTRRRRYLYTLESAVNQPGAEVGYKALRLARMMQAGFPVPQGFVITDTAWCKFYTYNGIALSSTGNNSATATIKKILTGKFPPEMIKEIDETLSRCSIDRFAVRSSSVGEDSLGHSMAGQFTTCLNIPRDKVHPAVKKCWSSLYEAPVAAYQANRGSRADNRMGVILQRQIYPMYAGVLFSIDPVKNTTDYLVIEWIHGLGDKLVSGKVIPERIYVRRESAEVPANIPVVLAQAIKELYAYAIRAESLFNHPVDMEWCVDEAGLHILQARPVTTVLAADSCIWTNVNMTENFPRPLAPFCWSMVNRFYTSYMKNMLCLFGWHRSDLRKMQDVVGNFTGIQAGRIYYNLTNWYKILYLFPFGKWLVRFLNNYIGQHIPVGFNPPGRAGGFTKSIKRAWVKTLFWPRLLKAILETGHLMNHFERKFYRKRKEWRRRSYTGLNLHELQHAWADIFDFVDRHWIAPGIADIQVMIFTGLFDLLTERWLTEQTATITTRLLQGFVLKSTEPAKYILSIAQKIKSDDKLQNLLINKREKELEKLLPAVIKNQFAEFMELYGGRCYHDCMIVSPTFEERHDLFWDLVRSYQNIMKKEECPTGKLYAEDPDTALRLVIRELTWARKVLYSRVLRQAQKTLALRERGRLLQSLLFGEFRSIALAAGKILHENKYIAENEDIFFLHYDELEQFINGKFQFPETIAMMVRQRKESLIQNQNVEPPEFFVLKQGEYFFSDGPEISADIDCGNLQGIAVSRGSITGISRVIIDPAKDSPLQPGEILVARTTDPGWTPLFLIAGGLVLEKGSLLSHGAIVAREFGIPAVVGVNNATKIVGNGKKILVDGDRGIVKILENREP